jgi:hypothetical protein
MVDKWEHDEQHGYEDLDAFHAPSECGTIIHRGYCRKVEEAFAMLNLTLAEFDAIMSARIASHLGEEDAPRESIINYHG